MISEVPFGLRCQRHELRLHVRGEAGIFLGDHVGGDEFSRAANLQRARPVSRISTPVSRSLAMIEVEVLRRATGEFEIAVGDGSGHEERAGFDAVRNDGVRRAVQLFFPAHANRGSSRAFDVRSHFDQQVREVRNFRFARRVVDDAFRPRRGPRPSKYFPFR